MDVTCILAITAIVLGWWNTQKGWEITKLRRENSELRNRIANEQGDQKEGE